MKFIIVLCLIFMISACAHEDTNDHKTNAFCKISSNDIAAETPCRYRQYENGSFFIGKPDLSAIIGETTLISLAILNNDIAHVRGLTTDGVNSYWGEAKQSSDPSCWIDKNYQDFEICVYADDNQAKP